MSNPFDDLKTDDADEDESAVEDEPEEVTESEATAESESGADSSAVENEPSTAAASSAPETAPSTEAPVAETGGSDDAESTEQGSTRADDEDEETTADPPSPAETGPAFEYSDVQQKPFYARSETVTEFENQIRTTIVPTLAKANVLDEETREIHDAVLRLANEEPERIAELVLEERRQSERE